MSRLKVLARARLVEQSTASIQRWRMQDFVQSFATERGQGQAAQDACGSVNTLLLIYYLAGASAASAHLDASIPNPASWGFPDKEQALQWLDAEYANLIATARAADEGSEAGAVIALDLPRALFHISSVRRQPGDIIELSPIAQRAASRLHDRQGEAVVLRNKGSALVQQGQYAQAIMALQEALQIYREIGDEHGAGTALTNLGAALLSGGQSDVAVTALQGAVTIHQRLGARHSEGAALANLGAALLLAGRHEEAISTLENAAGILRELGDHAHRATALANLGSALQRAARHDEAISAYRIAARISRLADSPLNEARVLVLLAASYRQAMRFEEAIASLQEAARTYSDIGDKEQEIATLASIEELRQTPLTRAQVSPNPSDAEPQSPRRQHSRHSRHMSRQAWS